MNAATPYIADHVAKTAHFIGLFDDDVETMKFKNLLETVLKVLFTVLLVAGVIIGSALTGNAIAGPAGAVIGTIVGLVAFVAIQ